MADNAPQPPPVIFCQDSPKRVLVSVIRTTPIKPTCGGGGEPEPPPPLIPTSPGFSDFMVYPWRWGENAHNVTLSPGASGGAASAALPAAAATAEHLGHPTASFSFSPDVTSLAPQERLPELPIIPREQHHTGAAVRE